MADKVAEQLSTCWTHEWVAIAVDLQCWSCVGVRWFVLPAAECTAVGTTWADMHAKACHMQPAYMHDWPDRAARCYLWCRIVEFLELSQQ